MVQLQNRFLLVNLAEATSSCFASHQEVCVSQDPEVRPLVSALPLSGGEGGYMVRGVGRGGRTGMA